MFICRWETSALDAIAAASQPLGCMAQTPLLASAWPELRDQTVLMLVRAKITTS